LDWIRLAQDRDRWRAVVSMMMSLCVPRGMGEYPDQLSDCQSVRVKCCERQNSAVRSQTVRQHYDVLLKSRSPPTRQGCSLQVQSVCLYTNLSYVQWLFRHRTALAISVCLGVQFFLLFMSVAQPPPPPPRYTFNSTPSRIGRPFLRMWLPVSYFGKSLPLESRMFITVHTTAVH
jgi:hypothetical protein